eukprot:TRINITY_DN10135_c0_g1_i1.p1 TRINITY_DN10135_c0_g1~~TRINITY_DN10135_c0_g1_i1.p1  ORF type:complete len:367 (+),score=106.15 TRINITY_DN10135_c0_g1_i1:35-1135(+)
MPDGSRQQKVIFKEEEGEGFTAVRVKAKKTELGNRFEGHLVLERQALLFVKEDQGLFTLWKKKKAVCAFLTAQEILHLQVTHDRLIIMTDNSNADWCVQLLPDAGNTHKSVTSVAKEIRRFWRYFMGGELTCDTKITMKFKLSNPNADGVRKRFQMMKKNLPVKAEALETEQLRNEREQAIRRKRDIEASDEEEGVEMDIVISEGGLSSECEEEEEPPEEEVHMQAPDGDDGEEEHVQPAPVSAAPKKQRRRRRHTTQGGRSSTRSHDDSQRRRSRRSKKQGSDPFWRNFCASHDVLGQHWQSIEPGVEEFIAHKYSHSSLTQTDPLSSTVELNSSAVYSTLLDSTRFPSQSRPMLTARNLSRLGV